MAALTMLPRCAGPAFSMLYGPRTGRNDLTVANQAESSGLVESNEVLEMFSVFASLFSWGLSTGLSLRYQSHDPGAMADLVTHVEGFIIGCTGLVHLVEDLEPSLSQASQRAGVR